METSGDCMYYFTLYQGVTADQISEKGYVRNILGYSFLSLVTHLDNLSNGVREGGVGGVGSEGS